MGILVVMYADEMPDQIITLGIYTAEQIVTLLNLVKEYGARIESKEYIFFTAGFDLTNGRFEIVFMES